MKVEYFAMPLDSNVGWALAMITLTLIDFIVTNFMGGKHRKAHFSDEFMKDNFNE